MLSFCSPAYKGCAKSPLLEAECCVCKWETLLFPFLICYLWSLVWTKQKKPQRIKSTENAALGHRSILQFLIVKFTAKTQSVFVASPHYFLNALQSLLGMLGGMQGTIPRCAELCRCAQEAQGAGWMVITYMLLHPISWVDFPRGLDKAGLGTTGGRRRKRCWELETELTAALKRQKQWCQWVELTEGCLIYCFRNWLWFQQQFWPRLIVTSSTALAFGSAADTAQNTMAQSRQRHKEGAACAGMGNHSSFSLSLGTFASL